MKIRQFKKRQNFQCLYQSKSRRQNKPIYGMLQDCYFTIILIIGQVFQTTVAFTSIVYIEDIGTLSHQMNSRDFILLNVMF